MSVRSWAARYPARRSAADTKPSEAVRKRACSTLTLAAVVLALTGPAAGAPKAGRQAQAQGQAQAAMAAGVPPFSHVLVIVIENKEFPQVVGNPAMPNFNRWAGQYALLTRYHGVTHPSLPNYLALIGGRWILRKPPLPSPPLKPPPLH